MGPDNNLYQYSKWCLCFKDRELEKEFRLSYIHSTVETTKKAMAIAFFIYIISSFLDIPFYHTIRPVTFIVIYTIIVPISIVVYILSRYPIFKRQIIGITTAVIIIGGIGILIMVGMADPPINYFAHSAFIILFMCVYSITRILFIYATITCIFLIVCYECVFLYLKPIPLSIIIPSNFFMLSAFILSMIGGYIIEMYARKNFIQLKIIQNDAIKLNKLNKELKKLATIDPLTKLYNRSFMENKIEEAISLFKRKDMPISFLFLDVDNFKKINDTYGHSFGDKVLKQVAQLIRNSLRKEDLAFRYGGDEFCVLFINTGLEEAVRVGQRLLEKIKKYAREKRLDIGISGGCIQITTTLSTPDDIIKKADKVLYKAKHEGKGRIYKKQV